MTKRHRKNPHSPPARDPARPDPDEQSGSTGRDPGPSSDNPGVDGKPGTGANTGQGNYGQSGYGQGGYRKGGDSAPTYQKGVPGRDDARSRTSNIESGRQDHSNVEAREEPSHSRQKGNAK
jgi:hypothetical protein